MQKTRTERLLLCWREILRLWLYPEAARLEGLPGCSPPWKM